MAATARTTAPHRHLTPVSASPKAKLEVVTAPRRRRGVRFASVGFVVAFGLMLGVTAVQVEIARNQLIIDSTSRLIEYEEGRTEHLRLEYARLMSPEYLDAEARALGLVPRTSREVLTVGTDITNIVRMSAGTALPEEAVGDGTPLGDYVATKAQRNAGGSATDGQSAAG